MIHVVWYLLMCLYTYIHVYIYMQKYLKFNFKLIRQNELKFYQHSTTHKLNQCFPQRSTTSISRTAFSIVFTTHNPSNVSSNV